MEPARGMGKDQAGVGVAFAAGAEFTLVAGVGQRIVAYQVQGDDPSALVGQLPDPLGEERAQRRLEGRLNRTEGVVGLEAGERRRLEQRSQVVRRHLRRDQRQRAASRTGRRGRQDPGVDRRDPLRTGRGDGDEEGPRQAFRANLPCKVLPPDIRRRFGSAAGPDAGGGLSKIGLFPEVDVGIEQPVGEAAAQCSCQPLVQLGPCPVIHGVVSLPGSPATVDAQRRPRHER